MSQQHNDDRMPSYDEDPEGEGGRIDETSSTGPRQNPTGKGRAVDGIGGTGGASGAGGLRAAVRPERTISGIDEEEQPSEEAAEEERPFRDATGHYASDTLHRVAHDGGNPGKSRGHFSETIPNSDEGQDPQNERRRSRDHS